MPVMNQSAGENWAMLNADCCDAMKEIPDNSVDFCIHSPPFANLYIYSDSEADMGNCRSTEEFIEHYRYAIRELYRITIPGRLCAIHVKDLPKYANRDGTTGLERFPDKCADAFEAEGWTFHSRVTIWKCPVTERERTNNNGLLHKTILRDRSQVRQGMADFLLVFRKPPVGTLMSDKPISSDGLDMYVGQENPLTCNNPHPSKYARKSYAGNPSVAIWQRYAEPVWWDVSQTNVLNFKLATDRDDERHICPLQLDVIERAIHLWTLEGETVLSPFAGIGSEGVGALRLGRKFLGIELKTAYFNHACEFLRKAELKEQTKEATLFDFTEEVPCES